MLITIIQVTIAFLAGILVGASGYYQYANYMFRKYPEFFRYRLNQKIGNRHTCHQAFDESNGIFCRKPASNQCVECHGWFCDQHFNVFMQRCDPDSELKAVKEQ